MRLPIVGLLAVLALAGCQPAPPQVSGAWVRLPAVAGRPGAAYFTLKAGRQSMTLLSIRTPVAGRSELHETMRGSGAMMSMRPIAQATVPAGGTLTFAPGGKHAMLFDIAPALKAGATTTLTLAFADGRTIDAKADVRGAGDAAP